MKDNVAMRAKLKLLRGSNKGKLIEITKTKFVIGRTEGCHLRPKHEGISRRHCELALHADKVTIEDLGSRNGTFLNGERVEKATELATGDELRMGPLKFEVVVTDDQGKVMVPPGPDPEEHSFGNVAGDSGLIGQWLEEAEDEETSTKTRPTAETRQFKLDETELASLENAAASDDSESKAFFGLGKKKDKKKPGKLPTNKGGEESANSREAAAETLKKLFNRGS